MTPLDLAKPLADSRSAAARAMAARPHLDGLGEFVKEQRRSAQLTLRQLADQAGVSNPYLSQIERGLRRPSAEVLKEIARALQISAETLYVRAGFLDPHGDGDLSVEGAVLADPALSERHKRLLLDIYRSLRDESASVSSEATSEQPEEPAAPTGSARPARRRTSKRQPERTSR